MLKSAYDGAGQMYRGSCRWFWDRSVDKTATPSDQTLKYRCTARDTVTDFIKTWLYERGQYDSLDC